LKKDKKPQWKIEGLEMEKTIKVKWVRSTIGRTDDQKKTIRGLGFKRLHQTLTLPDRPEIRGMVNRVLHLLEVKE
jgi:large subunit ribosomal protein L30